MEKITKGREISMNAGARATEAPPAGAKPLDKNVYKMDIAKNPGEKSDPGWSRASGIGEKDEKAKNADQHR